MLEVEVSTMTGIGIPTFDPTAVTGGSIWPGIIAAVVFVVVFAIAIRTYLRARPEVRDEAEAAHELTLPKAA